MFRRQLGRKLRAKLIRENRENTLMELEQDWQCAEVVRVRSMVFASYLYLGRFSGLREAV
jgi:hypothetical protein